MSYDIFLFGSGLAVLIYGVKSVTSFITFLCTRQEKTCLCHGVTFFIDILYDMFDNGFTKFEQHQFLVSGRLHSL